MIQGLRKNIIVNEEGRIEIQSPELHRGNKVEVIVLVIPEEDTTEYLLSTEANRLHLNKAMQQLEKQSDLIYVDPDAL